jgi:uncharacterized protein (TIGR02145 family)
MQVIKKIFFYTLSILISTLVTVLLIETSVRLFVDNGFNYDGSNTHQNFEKLGKAMSSNTGWLSSSVIGDVGNNQNTNNTSGFNATPNGTRTWGDNGSSFFERKGWQTHYWTTTENGSNSVSRHTFALYYGYPHAITGWPRYYETGSSVRFIKD